MFDAIRIAHAAGLLEGLPRVPPRGVPLRLLVLTDKPSQAVRGTVAGKEIGEGTADGDVVVFEIGPLNDASDARVELTASGEKAAVRAFWLVSREPELPPPPPEAWDAGDGDVDPRGPGK
jgi:hypothetical protein